MSTKTDFTKTGLFAEVIELHCTGVSKSLHIQVSRPICSSVYVFLINSSDALIIFSFRVKLGSGVTGSVT